MPLEEQLHDRLAAELDERAEPPLGDLVAVALHEGKRLRRNRRVTVVAGALAVVAVLAVGALLGGRLVAGPGRVPAATNSGSTLTVAPATTGPAATTGLPSAATLPATPAAIVYRVGQLLPADRISDVATVRDGSLNARLYLNRGAGIGMVTVTVGRGGPDCSNGACKRERDGTVVVVLPNAGNCVQSEAIQAGHPDGTLVQVDLSTCLMWNGTANPPAANVLSVAQAITIATDPSWGLRMNAGLVVTAARTYPSL